MNEAIFSGVLTKVYEQVSELLGDTYHAAKADIENSYHQYYEQYLERHGIVKVFCVGMREPIPLDDVYVAVQFLDEDAISRYKSSEDAERAFRERGRKSFNLDSDERQDGTQIANSKQFLMLLGGPGVGKSTFLRKVGLEALKGKKGNFTHTCIPVFLELKNFKEDEIDIEALITHEFETCGFPHPKELTENTLKLGDLLILFDGLDEVPKSNVDNVINKIGDFVDKYSQNRFIASCRLAAYKGGFKRFTEVEMADFEDSQIQNYIKNWFASTPDPQRHQLDESMETADRCWTMLNSSEHSATKELAGNPLLLTLLCMVYDRSQSLPRNRAALYEKALDVFLEEWAAEKRVHRGASMNLYLDIADETRMLSKIAAENFEENRLFFSKSELIKQIQKFGESNTNTLKTFNASEILDTILVDQGLFVERVRDSYSFSHLTFQEYLTANYITGDTRSIQGLVNQHLYDELWREVFLLTAGLMRDADQLLIAMEEKVKKSINTPRLKSLLEWTVRITDITDSQYSVQTKRNFAIHQYFLLKYLNDTHKIVKNKDKEPQDTNFDLFFGSSPHLYFQFNLHLKSNFKLYPDLYFEIDQSRNIYQNSNPNLNSDINLYLYQVRHLSPNIIIYHDFYRYISAGLHFSDFSDFADRFDEDLSERIKVINHIMEIKIFKDVNLEGIIQRFNEEQKFIKAVEKGKIVEPPIESIHDTWLTILGITDDMLAISDKEIENCFQYLHALELIIACKEAAAHVSPDVWERIEKRFFPTDLSSTT